MAFFTPYIFSLLGFILSGVALNFLFFLTVLFIATSSKYIFYGGLHPHFFRKICFSAFQCLNDIRFALDVKISFQKLSKAIYWNLEDYVPCGIFPVKLLVKFNFFDVNCYSAHVVYDFLPFFVNVTTERQKNIHSGWVLLTNSERFPLTCYLAYRVAVSFLLTV